MTRATLLARIQAKLEQLPDADLSAIDALVEMLPSTKLAAELRARDAAQLRIGDTGASARPPDGAEVVTRALVLKVMKALGGRP